MCNFIQVLLLLRNGQLDFSIFVRVVGSISGGGGVNPNPSESPVNAGTKAVALSFTEQTEQKYRQMTENS